MGNSGRSGSLCRQHLIDARMFRTMYNVAIISPLELGFWLIRTNTHTIGGFHSKHVFRVFYSCIPPRIQSISRSNFPGAPRTSIQQITRTHAHTHAHNHAASGRRSVSASRLRYETRYTWDSQASRQCRSRHGVPFWRPHGTWPRHVLPNTNKCTQEKRNAR